MSQATKEVIWVNDQWYVLATSSRADDRTRVLKHDEMFAVLDRHGDICPLGLGEQGLYFDGTRHLCSLALDVNGTRPLLLNSSVRGDNGLLAVDMTTPDLDQDGEPPIPKGTVHLFRSVLLREGIQYTYLRVVNYGDRELHLRLGLGFAADFADIFEVRGARRTQRGRMLPVRRIERGLLLGYVGLDGVERRTRILFDTEPDAVEDDRVELEMVLSAFGGQRELYFTIGCESGDQQGRPLAYARAIELSAAERHESERGVAHLYTTNEQFNDWVNRSIADLHMLITRTPHGLYPYAGVPWFSTAFGRDGIITALQCLWIYPGLARGVLGYLAALQADCLDPARDAEPGKILHETRGGEMAALAEVPFARYYGTVDATPLFVVLAGRYYQRTGDRGFLEHLWPNVRRALDWIDAYGDVDGDGFVEYQRHNAKGLVNQGWKDSDDSVFHADGSLARGAIALCEVQGYVYEAKRLGADLAALFGDKAYAVRLEAEAERLKRRFNEVFWCEELGTYALALDGDKRPCKVRTSNAGHALFSGIATPERACRVADGLLDARGFAGWGVRTLAAGESRFNPMSYHNGSIWPHDNAIIAMGLAQYGLHEHVQRIFTGLFDASIGLDLNRLPELFCGFERLQGQAPTLYPVACSPQAWASGAVFHLLQASLGMTFAPEKPQLRLQHPRLPPFLQCVQIRNLPVGNGWVDLDLHRHPKDVGVNVLRKNGDIEVAIVV